VGHDANANRFDYIFSVRDAFFIIPMPLINGKMVLPSISFVLDREKGTKRAPAYVLRDCLRATDDYNHRMEAASRDADSVENGYWTDISESCTLGSQDTASCSSQDSSPDPKLPVVTIDVTSPPPGEKYK